MIAPPAKRPRHLVLTLALAALIVALLAYANRHYLFQSEQYEADDMAANALSILRAEHFHQVYGQYSRWGFRHPGPAIFYWLGLGEKVFYQWLRVVPTPFNAQVLALLILFACLLAASVSTAARWMRGRLFLPLATLVTVLHFTAVDTRKCLTGVWPPFEMVMPFVLLMVTAASVMAGEGNDLPLLALAGCLLIHLHVAQPLFVLPMFALAYAGLTWACRSRPWRVYWRAHGFALGLAVAFALPVVFDFCRGSRSNLHLILEHVQTHSGEDRHPWLDSVYYFLRFGVYKPSLGEYVFFGHGDHRAVLRLFGLNIVTTELVQFLGSHLRMLAIWLGALLLILVAGVRRLRREEGSAETAGRWRFLICLGIVWAVCAGLTVVWGHVQDGDMFYFNAWFDYGIYYVLGLVAAGALADTLETAVSNARRPRVWTAAVAALCLLGAAVRIAVSPGRYTNPDNPERVAQAHTVFDTLASDPDPQRPKMLFFPHDSWVSATTVASLLERRGIPFRVPTEWENMFGDEYGLEDLSSVSLQTADGVPRFDFWRVIPASELPAAITLRPLAAGNALLLGGLDLNPNPGASIDFVGGHINSDLYVLTGFSGAQPGDTYVWSEGKRGLVYFHPKPVPEGSAVEIAFDFGPNALFGTGFVQRLTLRYDGTDLGTQHITVGPAAGEPVPLPKFLVPAALWNQHPDALLDLGFPDTISPQDKKINLDPRQLGFASRRITFRVIPPGDARQP